MSLPIVTAASRCRASTQNSLRRWLYSIIFFVTCALLLTGCPGHLGQPSGSQFYFAGRLAMSIAAAPNIQNSKSESWSAHFELLGTPAEGELRLTTPIGTTVALVHWTPDNATVQTSKETLVFANLDELSANYFNQTIPVAALFDWLAGKQSEENIPGWDVNLTRTEKGIISAERNFSSAPKVNLRAVVNKKILPNNF